MRKYSWILPCALGAVLSLTSCKTSKSYQITDITADRIQIGSQFDVSPSVDAIKILTPYKQGVDSVMNTVIGYSASTLDKYRPESPLSNLIADVLRNAAIEVIGKPADIGLMNIGGIRNILPEGNITTRTIFEILPFENSLCVLKIKGRDVRELMNNIAKVKGEGISNINLVVENGTVIKALVGGEEIVDEKTYTLATIDYIAEGNDGMVALKKAESKICPDGATLRGLFLKFVEDRTNQGEIIDASVEGRIIIK